MPLAGSSPGSDAFYRRSMRKGTGGDAEGEAMRANLTFQNTLRVDAHGAGTPDASQTLSAKRSRRARKRSRAGARQHAHGGGGGRAPGAPVGREPVTAQGGDHAPEAGVGAAKAAAADAAAFPAWLPVEAMPPAPPQPRREDPAQAHADDSLRHARRGGAAAATIADKFGDTTSDRSGRRDRAAVPPEMPSGQRATFGFATRGGKRRRSRTSVSAPSNTSPKNAFLEAAFSPRTSRRICVRRGERSRC